MRLIFIAVCCMSSLTGLATIPVPTVSASASLKEGEQILQDTQKLIAQASEVFKVRGFLRKVSKRLHHVETKEAIILAASAAALVTASSYIGWDKVLGFCGNVLYSPVYCVLNFPKTSGVVALAVALFIAINKYSASAYCWSAVCILDALSYQCMLDDFFADRVANQNIAAYVIANYGSVLAAIRYYQETSALLNQAQELLTKSVVSSDKEIVQMSRLLLDLVRRFETQIEKKLQYIYREMKEEYRTEKADEVKEDRLDKILDKDPSTNVHIEA
jgi:hypothetical protein